MGIARHLARWLGLVFGYACAIPIAMSQQPLSDHVDQASTCYASFDYDCVLEELGGFSIEEVLETESRADIELATRLLAITLIIRDVPDRARTVLADTLRVWPDFRFEGDDLSPRFLRVFDEAKALINGEAAGLERELMAVSSAVRIGSVVLGHDLASAIQQRTQSVVISIVETDRERSEHKNAQLRIEVGPSMNFLGGDDSEVYDGGIGIALRVGTEALFGSSLELAFDYHSYGLVLTDLVEEVENDLKVLNIGATIGAPVRFGLFRLEVGGGAGYSSFGFANVFERGGLLLELYAQFGVQLPGSIGIAVETRPRLVFVEGEGDETLISSPVLIGLTVSFELRFD